MENASSNLKNKILNNLVEIQENLVEGEFGVVASVEDSIVFVKDFKKIGFNEAVMIKDKYYGYVAVINENITKIVLLDKTNDILVGDQVKRLRKELEIPVGNKLIGRVIDGLGRPLDEKGDITVNEFLPIERSAKGILERKTVDTPLETGLKVVDCLIPVGRGQRELILGDRQTGKTSIAIDTILHQKNKNVICIYCAIGQRDSNVMEIINVLKENEAMKYTIIVNANASDLPGMQCIAAYSATSIAEYFSEHGESVLIIYDDLSKHAKAYREISLLLEKSPGREAYPGDIFYLHSRLLERSVNLRKEFGGGSITSLPIIETEGENISAFIPTNIISITDGQLYLSPSNFQNAMLPAIDVGQSVSRVGGKAQLKAYKQIAGKIGMEYSQFEELEMFSKFATKLDDETQKVINKGRLIRETLKQNRFKTVPVEGQIAVFMCIRNDIFEKVSVNNIAEVEDEIVKLVQTEEFLNLRKTIKINDELQEEQIQSFLKKAKDVVDKFNFV
jgi:F-type H+-transporting ATPase subunit alpha